MWSISILSLLFTVSANDLRPLAKSCRELTFANAKIYKLPEKIETRFEKDSDVLSLKNHILDTLKSHKTGSQKWIGSKSQEVTYFVKSNADHAEIVILTILGKDTQRQLSWGDRVSGLSRDFAKLIVAFNQTSIELAKEKSYKGIKWRASAVTNPMLVDLFEKQNYQIEQNAVFGNIDYILDMKFL